MANLSKSTQPNPLVTELITITIPTTIYPKKIEEFPEWRIFLLKILSLPKIFDLNVFVVFGNCSSFDLLVTGLLVVQFCL